VAPSPAEHLSEEGLAARSGTTRDMVRRLLEVGILASSGLDGTFLPSDLPKVRLAVALHESGIWLEQVGGAIRAGKLSLGFVERRLPNPVGVLPRTYREFAASLNVPEDLFERVQVALGIPPSRWDERIREDDAEIYRLLMRAADQGVPHDTLARSAVVYCDNLRRIAVMERQTWESDVEGPMLASGLRPQQVLDVSSELAPGVQGLASAAVTLFHDRFLEEVVFQQTMNLLEEALEDAGVTPARKTRNPAIAFLDLTGFTLLTDEWGDERAAEQAQQLSDLAQTAAITHQGRVVKLLGDGVMFYFADPQDAVRCGLDLIDLSINAGLPPARVGADAGQLISREGDFYGRTVNVAARVADYARPREVLVTDRVVAASSEARAAFREIGPISLRGVAEPVKLYVASRTES
jgi:adenylate cyclase